MINRLIGLTLLAFTALNAQGQRERSSFPFHAVGIYWRDPAIRTVRARASRDGSSWTSWMTSHGELVDKSRMGSGLIYFGDGYREVEIDGVADAQVLFIDPGPSPTGAKPRPRTTDDNPPPEIITREQWGCTPESCPVKDPPVYTTVTHLIVHHTDGGNDATDWSAVVRSIWVLHVMGNGWNDIGYNYLIDPEGRLYEGRAGGDGVMGAHFSGVNSGTMGVALLGTFIDVSPSGPMLDMLEQMLAWQARKWKVDPGGESLHASSGLVLNVISGHRDANISPNASGATECPGNTAYTYLPQVRQHVLRRTSLCVLSIGERNRCVPSEGGTIPIGLELSSSCSTPVTINTGAAWVRTDPVSAELIVMPNEGSRRNTTIDVGGQWLNITQAGKDEGPLPCVAMRGIVNGADFDPRPVVSGSLVAIFGENFDSGATAAINGRPATVEYAGTGQINVIMPPNLALGTNHLTVTAHNVAGPQTNFWVTEAMPAIFTDGNGRAIAIQSGDDRTLTVFLTGVGNAAYPWSATIQGKPAEAKFLGLLPQILGVFRADIGMPSDLAAGEVSVSITVQGVTSRQAAVTVSR